jgi:hypothetical protein
MEYYGYICIVIILEVLTGRTFPIEILPLETTDYKMLSKAQYFFDWKAEKSQEVYKLVRKGQNDILGLVSLERIPSEWRIHLRLLTVSKENQGKKIIYDRIAGNLIAYAAKIAVAEFGPLACISMRPKSSIVQHYITQYKMNLTGMTLSLEVPEIIQLIKRYE